jgi:hypothetical protein
MWSLSHFLQKKKIYILSPPMLFKIEYAKYHLIVCLIYKLSSTTIRCIFIIMDDIFKHIIQ